MAIKYDTPWNQLVGIVRVTLDDPPATISKTTTFDDLGADSLDVICVVLEVEHEFSVLISDDVMAKWKTLGDVMVWLEENADLSKWEPSKKAVTTKE